MHRIAVRFRVVRNSRIIEAFLDRRLSFKENMDMLNRIMEEKINDFYVYDPYKKVFLDRNMPLSEFSFRSFMFFYLF